MATIAVSALAHADDGARTDWFKDAGYGLFCHWGSRSVNADGSKNDYCTAATSAMSMLSPTRSMKPAPSS